MYSKGLFTVDAIVVYWLAPSEQKVEGLNPKQVEVTTTT